MIYASAPVALAAPTSSMFVRDPGILGERYALPYLRLEPELCAVAVESETGYIVGYAVATLDTGEFCARIQVDYLPGVRDRYPDPHQKPRSAWTAEDLVARDLHDPLCGRYVACVVKFPSNPLTRGRHSLVIIHTGRRGGLTTTSTLRTCASTCCRRRGAPVSAPASRRNFSGD